MTWSCAQCLSLFFFFFSSAAQVVAPGQPVCWMVWGPQGISKPWWPPNSLCCQALGCLPLALPCGEDEEITPHWNVHIAPSKGGINEFIYLWLFLDEMVLFYAPIFYEAWSSHKALHLSPRISFCVVPFCFRMKRKWGKPFCVGESNSWPSPKCADRYNVIWRGFDTLITRAVLIPKNDWFQEKIQDIHWCESIICNGDFLQLIMWPKMAPVSLLSVLSNTDIIKSCPGVSKRLAALMR